MIVSTTIEGADNVEAAYLCSSLRLVPITSEPWRGGPPSFFVSFVDQLKSLSAIAVADDTSHYLLVVKGFSGIFYSKFFFRFFALPFFFFAFFFSFVLVIVMFMIGFFFFFLYFFRCPGVFRLTPPLLYLIFFFFFFFVFFLFFSFWLEYVSGIYLHPQTPAVSEAKTTSRHLSCGNHMVHCLVVGRLSPRCIIFFGGFLRARTPFFSTTFSPLAC